jgi:hypothetical protein
MSRGYGRLYPEGMKGRSVLAHRWTWEQAYGPIPEGMQVCHRCDNPPCVRLDHLFLGTAADNMTDKQIKHRAHRMTELQTHCHRGHEFTVENTRWGLRKGYRVRTCRTCRHEDYVAKRGNHAG